MEIRDASTFDATVKDGVLYTREVMYAGKGKHQVALSPIAASDPQATEAYYAALADHNMRQRETAYAVAAIPVLLTAPASLYALHLLNTVTFTADGRFDPNPVNLVLAIAGGLMATFAVAVNEGSRANDVYTANKLRLTRVRQAIRRDKVRQKETR